jgi:hypothetical protein
MAVDLRMMGSSRSTSRTECASGPVGRSVIPIQRAASDHLRFSRRPAVGLVLALVVAILALSIPFVQPLLEAAQDRAWRRFYVSPNGDDANPGTSERPFASLDGARLAVRSLTRPWAGDVIVELRAGTHHLGSTVTFDDADSGRDGYRVYYQPTGYGTARTEPVSLSGGQEVMGWSDADGNGVYEAPAPAFEFRQLYVNGRRAIRARTPNVGAGYSEADFFKVAAWDPPGLGPTASGIRRVGLHTADIPAAILALPAPSLNRVELVLQKKWYQNRYRIASFEKSQSITFAVPMEPDGSNHRWEPPRIDGQWYHFENALVLLDQPGEWFLDTTVTPRRLYYKPLPGEGMETAVIVAPRLETLVKLQGTLDVPVRDITLRGLTFEHTGWTAPSISGFVGGHAGNQPAHWTQSAAIHLQAAEHIVLERNVVQHIGCTGIALHSGTHSNLVRGNRVRDVSLDGISVDSILQSHPIDTRVISKDDVIENNFIAHVGQDYYQGVGIFAGFTDSLRIEHNEVVYAPYDGILFSPGSRTEPSAIRNNKIRYNKLHNVMRLMEDGGAIYTTSRQSPTGRFEDGLEISENYIGEVRRISSKNTGPVVGIYLDDKTDWVVVKDNVFSQVTTGVLLHDTGENILLVNSDGSGNRFANPGPHESIQQKAGLQFQYLDMRSPEYDMAPESPVSNLIENGSFELDGDGDGYPDAWAEYKRTRNSRDSKIVKSGSSSLGALGPADVYSAQSVGLKPNTRYRLWGYVKTEGVVGRGVWFRYAELVPDTVVYNGLLNSAVTGTNDWTRLETTFKTSPNYQAGRLDVLFELSSGTAWVDDLVLCEEASEGCR